MAHAHSTPQMVPKWRTRDAARALAAVPVQPLVRATVYESLTFPPSLVQLLSTRYPQARVLVGCPDVAYLSELQESMRIRADDVAYAEADPAYPDAVAPLHTHARESLEGGQWGLLCAHAWPTPADEERVLSAWYRLLAPGGMVLVLVPFTDEHGPRAVRLVEAGFTSVAYHAPRATWRAPYLGAVVAMRM